MDVIVGVYDPNRMTAASRRYRFPDRVRWSTVAQKYNGVDNGIDGKESNNSAQDPFPCIADTEPDKEQSNGQLDEHHSEIGGDDCERLPFNGPGSFGRGKIDHVLSHAIMRLKGSKCHENNLARLFNMSDY